ncbi:MAG: hypothetical protein ACFE9D_02900 [Promethearchaeota archaeon]
MPHIRSSKIAPIGLLIGFGLAVVLYFTQTSAIQAQVYGIYFPFIDLLQLFELAWIMATVDLLLDFTFPISLMLWLSVAIIIALLFRNLSAALSTLSASLLLPAGTWLLFMIKYLYLPGFSIAFLTSFFLWQILVPLGLVFGVATLITFPFALYRRQQPPLQKIPSTIHSTCTSCGAVYHSQPLICVYCGKEGSIIETHQDES